LCNGDIGIGLVVPVLSWVHLGIIFGIHRLMIRGAQKWTLCRRCVNRVPSIYPHDVASTLDADPTIEIGGTSDILVMSSSLPVGRVFNNAPYVRSALGLFLFCYNPITRTLFEYFTCTSVNGGYRLVSSYPAVSCDSSSYTALMYVPFSSCGCLLGWAVG
jgi:hypothetical protein